MFHSWLPDTSQIALFSDHAASGVIGGNQAKRVGNGVAAGERSLVPGGTVRGIRNPTPRLVATVPEMASLTSAPNGRSSAAEPFAGITQGKDYEQIE